MNVLMSVIASAITVGIAYVLFLTDYKGNVIRAISV